MGSNRLEGRRGSVPTTMPSMGIRGGVDRRSDPTQYHSGSHFDTGDKNSGNVDPKGSNCSSSSHHPGMSSRLQTRRGSAPLDLRQSKDIYCF